MLVDGDVTRPFFLRLTFCAASTTESGAREFFLQSRRGRFRSYPQLTRTIPRKETISSFLSESQSCNRHEGWRALDTPTYARTRFNRHTTSPQT